MLKRELLRRKRHRRLRKTLTGTPEKPRLNVYRSICNIFAQLVDDESGKTLAAASTVDKDLKGEIKTGGNVEAAKVVGQALGKRALDAGISTMSF